MARRKKRKLHRSSRYRELRKLKVFLKDRWTDLLVIILIIIIAYLAYKYGPRI